METRDRSKKNKWVNKMKKHTKDFFRHEKRPAFNTAEVGVVIVISLLFGVVVGCILTYGKGLVVGIDDKYAKELVRTYDTILENYYNDVTEDELINAAINGMVDSLGDAHSYYMDSTETYNFNQRVDGSYVGIGATISFSETGNTIIEMFEDGPAAKAGLKVGDVILEVDGKNVSSATVDELSKLLVGEADTTVSIKVDRDGKEKSVKLKRKMIIIPSVFSKTFEKNDKNFGFIDIDNFAANTYSQFKEQLVELEKKDIDGLIIDVRNNLGGHLNQVDKILSLFFNKKTVLYQLETKNGVENVYSTGGKTRDYEVVVLIDNFSASASEILASCFRENYKNATVVGVTSYGKGTVQSAIKLSTGASLKYTSQRWLTSKGEWLDGVGVVPDEEISAEDSGYVVTGDNDLQFQRALEILSK